jgi:ribosomal protein L37E
LDETKKDEVHKICAACGYEGSDNMKSERLTKFIAKTLHDTAVKEKRNQN